MATLVKDDDQPLTPVEKCKLFDELAELLRNNSAENAKKLLNQHPFLATYVDSCGRNSTHWAAVGGCLPIIELLLKKNPQLMIAADDSGWTILMLATSAGRHDVVRYLLSSVMCDINKRNDNGQSALHYAASKNRAYLVGLLLSNGANPNLQDKYGATPLHRAAAQGHNDCIDLLCATKNLRIDIKNSEGNTAVHLACEEQHESIAIALAQRGAVLLITNKEGKTALDLCKSAEFVRKLKAFT